MDISGYKNVTRSRQLFLNDFLHALIVLSLNV